MDKKTAQLLIEDTFNNAFNEEQFMVFTKNLLNDLEPKNNFYTGNLIWDDYKEHINTYKRIGKYIDPEGEALDVLIVEVKSLTKLERARTALRNFVIKHLSKFEKDYALVAFYSKEDGGADWRFSFIKLEYRSELDEEKGKVKLKKEFTPAKRYSFLVGKYEKAHTAKNQLLPLLQNIANNPTIEELEAAFSIEKVTDEFFSQYEDLYVKLYKHFENDSYVKSAIERAKIDNTRFTKKLLGQIVFLYFLQKKGWLGVAQNERWGTGKKRFVQELFDQAKAEGVNFFKDKLQYLFYEALAKERDTVNSYYKPFECRIPFLNGGLFEADYDWQNANITIPENLFRNEEKNKSGDVGTGVLDVFDRYNFTIKEDEPLDKEVAVDPEMLGKVFENMLDTTERKSKGAFYTPREIVHYMCQESLIHYLDNALGGKVEKEDIEDFIRNGHSYLENDINALNKIDRIKAGEQKSTNAEFKLSESIRQNADLIDRKLIDIRICDPAIGSGAFPVGLLHELVNAMLVLKPYLSYDYLTDKLKNFGFEHRESISDSRYIYRLKRHIIQESIYGVDIDVSAIDIARLRLWLSLVVDEDDLDPIETLPNLDYKIVCGNSLISRYALDIPINDVFVEFNKKIRDKNYANTTIKELIGKNEVNLEFYKKITNDFLIESSHEKKNLFRELIKEMKSAFRSNLNDKEKMKLSKARALVENLQTIDMFGKQTGTVKEITQAKKSLSLLEKERDETLNGQIYKDAIEWRFEFPNLLDDKGNFVGFDVVIGNPPYLSYYGRRRTLINNEVENFFRNNFDCILDKKKTGKYNSVMFFQEKALRISNKSGIQAYIIDVSFFENFYGGIKKELIEKTQILTIIKNLSSFENVASGQLIIITNKNKASQRKTEWFENGFGESSFVDQNLWYSKDKDYQFFLPKNNIQSKILNKISGNNKCIEYYFPKMLIRTGESVGVKESGFVIDEVNHSSDKEIYEYLEGGKSLKGQYEPLNPTRYFVYDVDLLNEKNQYYREDADKNNRKNAKVLGIGDKLAFDNPKILVRQSSPIICASYTDKKYVYNRSYYSISQINSSDSANFSLLYTLGLLNSSVLTFYAIHKGLIKQEKGKQPQIRLGDLKMLPIVNPNELNRLTLEILVRYVLFLKSVTNDIECAFFIQLVDGIVIELYFPEEIKSAGKEILKHLGDLKPISDDMNEEEKLAIIQSEFERLYDPNHPVRFAIETLDSVEEVRIIKEALK